LAIIFQLTIHKIDINITIIKKKLNNMINLIHWSSLSSLSLWNSSTLRDTTHMNQICRWILSSLFLFFFLAFSNDLFSFFVLRFVFWFWT
jgi:hypothetical protein